MLFQLKYTPLIEDIILDYNPVKNTPNYKNIILTILPNVKSIDG